jgi:hypothetical protein
MWNATRIFPLSIREVYGNNRKLRAFIVGGQFSYYNAKPLLP